MTRSVVAVGLLILGLGFLGIAGYLWVENDLRHYGQSTYAVTGIEGTDIEATSTIPENASVIDYRDLPPRAQQAFDSARRGEGNRLWSASDRRAVEAILPYSGGFVEYDGQYYQIEVLSGHRSWWPRLLEFVGALAMGLVLTGVATRPLIRSRVGS